MRDLYWLVLFGVVVMCLFNLDLWIHHFSLLSLTLYSNWTLQASISVFLMQVGNISNSNRFLLKFLQESTIFFVFYIGAQANHFSFWYIDLQISAFNQIPFGILIFFHSLIFQIDQLWYCDKLGLRPWRHGEQTLTFLYPVSPYLRASGQLYQVFNCPWLGLRDQSEQNRILKLE